MGEATFRKMMQKRFLLVIPKSGTLISPAIPSRSTILPSARKTGKIETGAEEAHILAATEVFFRTDIWRRGYISMALLKEKKQFERIVQKIDPRHKLIRAWELKGGISARVTALEIEQFDGQRKKLIVRQHGAV